jgi:CubicO group peptidase (beta-lactamase class C family)
MQTFRLRMAILASLAFAGLGFVPAGAEVPFPQQDPAVPYPLVTWPEAEADSALHVSITKRMETVLDAPKGALARTKAMIIVHGGKIIGEWYGKGISPDTRLQSWSVAKSMLHAALGLAIADGRIAPSRPLPAPEWQSKEDPRKRITVLQLAQMTDGLRFDENYADAGSHAMQMLFGGGRGDVGAAAARASLAHEPGTHWSYSSGSANILSRHLRDRLGGGAAYARFLRERLLDRLGMRSAFPEFDAAGTWIGSSYVHATARDYARFGLLYLRGGFWNGEQLIPRDWVERARTPTMASRGEYGALFWLNAADPDTGKAAISARLPEDLFLARGFGGQIIAIVPSRDAVVVMLNANYADDPSPIIDLVASLLNLLPSA